MQYERDCYKTLALECCKVLCLLSSYAVYAYRLLISLSYKLFMLFVKCNSLSLSL